MEIATPRLAKTDAELLRCFPVMLELRPTLREEEFVAAIRGQESEGYRLAMLEDAGGVTTVGGFRVQRMLMTGKTMYVDDLVTAAAARSRGHGKAMLHWLMEIARREDCDSFSLDSGTQRQEAHAFYLRERMRITSFHFCCKL
jgi:GNAT superfamily N-acetyltransferase